MVPASTAASSKSTWLARQPAVVGQPVEHRVERNLLQHEPAAAARVVQLVHVPLAEEIVGPFVHRMVEVVGPRVKRQLVELFEGEHGLEHQRGIGGVENGQGRLDQFTIRSRRGPRPANPQRHRPDPLVVVRLDFLFGAEHGHGPVAEIIVQLAHGGRHDAIGLLPRPALLQHGLAHPADPERLEQRFFGLVEQQIAVELAVGRQRGVEDQPQHGLGLLDLAKGVGRAADRLQLGAQHPIEGLPGRLPRRRRRLDPAEQVAQVLQEPGVRRARGEVQVAEDVPGQRRDVVAQLRVIHFGAFLHSANPLW